MVEKEQDDRVIINITQEQNSKAVQMWLKETKGINVDLGDISYQVRRGKGEGDKVAVKAFAGKAVDNSALASDDVPEDNTDNTDNTSNEDNKVEAGGDTAESADKTTEPAKTNGDEVVIPAPVSKASKKREAEELEDATRLAEADGRAQADNASKNPYIKEVKEDDDEDVPPIPVTPETNDDNKLEDGKYDF